MTMLYLVAGGVLAGLLNGWLGVGGMVVLAPLLFFVFAGQAETGHLVPLVLSNAFPVLIAMGIGSWFFHHRQGMIVQSAIKPLFGSAALGALMGFAVAIGFGFFHSMGMLFGFYLLALSGLTIVMAMIGDVRTVPDLRSHAMGADAPPAFIGLAGGVVSGFIGFNGNSIFTPLLRSMGYSPRESIATGQAASVVVAVVMTLLVWIAFSEAIRLDVVAVLSLLSVGGAFFGARIKNAMSPQWIELALAAVYWLSGILLVTQVAK